MIGATQTCELKKRSLSATSHFRSSFFMFCSDTNLLKPSCRSLATFSNQYSPIKNLWLSTKMTRKCHDLLLLSAKWVLRILRNLNLRLVSRKQFTFRQQCIHSVIDESRAESIALRQGSSHACVTTKEGQWASCVIGRVCIHQTYQNSNINQSPSKNFNRSHVSPSMFLTNMQIQHADIRTQIKCILPTRSLVTTI